MSVKKWRKFQGLAASTLDLSGSENFGHPAIPTYPQMAQRWRPASPCVFRDSCPDHGTEASTVWLKKNTNSTRKRVLQSITRAMKFLFFLFRSSESENCSRKSRKGSSSPDEIGPIMKFTNTQNRLMAAKRQAFAIEAITTVRL